MTPEQRLWSRTRDDLVRAIESLGFPAELGEAIAKHLGSPKAMDRMISYLDQVKPKSEELVVDEMLAIRSEIDAWWGARGPVDLGFAPTGAERRQEGQRRSERTVQRDPLLRADG